MKFDDIDRQILDLLQTDSSITNAQLAAKAGISPSGMLERVKRLENAGVIRKYVAILDPEKVDRGILAFVSISLAAHKPNAFDLFTKTMNEMVEVLECYHAAGDEDFILKVAMKSISEYEAFLLNKLQKLKGINKIKTTFILSTLKYDTKIHLPEEIND